MTIIQITGQNMGDNMDKLKLFHSAVVQFGCSIVSDSLRPHGLQHARFPCPLPTHGSCSNSCPLSQWCHPTISSSVVPFSSSFNLSQHQNLFQWVSSSHQVAELLVFKLQHQSFHTSVENVIYTQTHAYTHIHHAKQVCHWQKLNVHPPYTPTILLVHKRNEVIF